MSKKKIIIIASLVVGVLVVVILALLIILFITRSKESFTESPVNEIVAVTKDKNAMPKIKNIGINIEPYNPATGKAGDILFKDLGADLDHMVFQHYGQRIRGNENVPNPGLNVHPEYFLPKGSKIFAVSDGVVSDVSTLYSSDFSVLVTPDDAPEWTLNYEHILNPTVKKGDRVKTGQIIAEVSTNQMNGNGFGKWALMIFKPLDNGIQSICPYTLFDESVKAEMQGKLTRLVKDWEAYMGRNIYDEEKWISPGCALEKMTEDEAKRL